MVSSLNAFISAGRTHVDIIQHPVRAKAVVSSYDHVIASGALLLLHFDLTHMHTHGAESSIGFFGLFDFLDVQCLPRPLHTDVCSSLDSVCCNVLSLYEVLGCEEVLAVALGLRLAVKTRFPSLS